MARAWSRNGDNRYHAIFGGGPAYFVSASSPGPALIALGAKVKLVSAGGSRSVPVEKFFVAPPTREIALLPNEILTEIEVPPARGIKNATYEVRQKEARDWPLVTASADAGIGGQQSARRAGSRSFNTVGGRASRAGAGGPIAF